MPSLHAMAPFSLYQETIPPIPPL